MLTLYGADLSAPAIRVKFVLNALGVNFTYRPIKIREGENKSEWFLKIHPAGKIPAIDDDGFTLFESGAICKYLCRKHNSDLYPKDIKQSALVDQWGDFAVIHVGGALGKVLYNRVFAPVIKVEVDERSLQEGLNFLKRFLPIVDNQLSKSKYLATDKLTLADISLLAFLDPAEAAQVDLTPYANIVRWRNALKKTDFYQKTHKEYGESLKGMTAQKS